VNIPLPEGRQTEAHRDRPLRVVVADDHPIVRDSLRNLLGRSGFDVVGEAASGTDAVAVTRACRPDVVLMDLSMPGGGGIEATAKITAADPNVAVVALTTFSDRDRVLDAIDAGVCGYLLKDDDPDELLRGIRAAAEGQSPVSPKVASVLIQARTARRAADNLTVREREILGLVAEGLANKQIAARLGITERTVKAHLGNTFQCIGVRNRTEAARWYLTHTS
jgi:DNA-binding NarL/FixJ family response regulator